MRFPRATRLVILCRDRTIAERALKMVEDWTAHAGLTLHPEKTCIVDAEEEGFDFLGYHFHAEHRWPRKKSLKKLRAAIRVKTKRANGHSLEYIIAGRVLSLQTPGCFLWSQPIVLPVNPRRGKTINRRAMCGRTGTARRVVRTQGGPHGSEGRETGNSTGLPYPYFC